MSSFAEIRSLTDAQARTLSYTETEIENILLPDSGLFLNPSPPTEDFTKRLKHLSQKEIRLQLHGITLSEYVRTRRIPRGLRIQKAPTIGRTDETFCTKWCEIMNKASLDLMVLIIDYTKKELTKIKEEISEIEEKIQTSTDPPALQAAKEEMQAIMDKYKEETQKNKLSKLRRDTMDYRNGKVYPWLLQAATPATRPRKQVRFRDATPYTSGSSSEYITDSDGDFLSEGEKNAKHRMEISARALRARNTRTEGERGGGNVGRGRGRSKRQGRF